MGNTGTDTIHTDLALRILDDRRAGKVFAPLPREAGIDRADMAYNIQDALNDTAMKARGTRLAGYKVGLTSRQMQEMCCIDSPVSGVVYADLVMDSPATVRADSYGRLGLEFEIAVTMATDLDASGRELGLDDVATTVRLITPAIELVDDRNCDYAGLDAPSLIADNSWNAGIVLGDSTTPIGDLRSILGIVRANGTEIGRGFGRDVLGHPYSSVLWLARHLAMRGDRLRKDDIVMTGSLIRTQFPSGPADYHFELAGIGAVTCSVR